MLESYPARIEKGKKKPALKVPCRAGSLSRQWPGIHPSMRSPAVPSILAFILALALAILPLAHGQNCCTNKPAKRAKAKSKGKRGSKEAKAKRQQAKARAQLEEAKSLLDAGKRDKAIPRLWKIVRRYPKTRATLEALILLRFTPP
jgi:hypothetical protein